MMKDLKYYLSLNYPITIEPYIEDGEVRYAAEIPDLPGCFAWGKTPNEAWEKVNESKEIWIETRIKKNLYIPEPVSEDDFSGKFILRIPTKLHMILSKQAKTNDLSLNQYVKSILEREVVLEYERKRTETRDQEILTEMKLLRDKISLLEERIKSFEEVSKSTTSYVKSPTISLEDNFVYVVATSNTQTKPTLKLVKPSRSPIDETLEDVAVNT